MPTNNEKFKLITQTWNKLIENNQKALSQTLSELNLSALNSWAGDCFQSFEKIYFNLLEEIRNAAPDNYDLIHDNVVDIFWQLDHIKKHIIDAEKGFSELMSLLAKKAEEKG